MKTLKALALISLSVFLLSLSWTLVAGELTRPPLAHAQLAGDVVQVMQTGNQSGANDRPTYAVFTTDGSVYAVVASRDISNQTLNGIVSSEYVGNITTGPIPTNQENVGRLKSNY